jgi:hypothetical protein
VTARAASRACLVALALAAAGCAAPAPQRCHRYDALALNPENGFAAMLDWKDELAVDTAPERIEIGFTIVKPLKGPVSLVHVVGDLEMQRWDLTPPESPNASAVCWISPRTVPANCGVALDAVPYFPGGYYYVRANGNTVLEAGLALYLCD